MTNQVEPSQTGTIPKLRWLLRHILELQTSANACANTLRWLSVHSLRSIPVLDFDIVYGALPSIEFEQSKDTDQDELIDTAPTVGPHTVRLLLKSTPEFCLPVGTAAELLQRLSLLKSTISHKARFFLDTVSDIQRSASVSTIARELRMEDFPDLLLNELASYERHAEDLSLLSSLLSRNTPYEKLVGKEHETKNIDAFRATLSYLKEQRHRRTHSNLFDAYNVACTVEIFNNPSTRGPDRRIPLFITDTQRLNSWSLSPWLKRNEFETVPDLSHDRFFLVIFQGILSRNNGVVRVAQDEASLLSRQLIEIAEIVKELLEKGQRVSATYSLDPQAVQLSHLPESKLLLLQHKFKRMTHSWNDILSPTFKAIEYDYVHQLNSSLRPHLVKLFTGDKRSKSTAVQAVVARLNDFRKKHNSFWELLQEHAKQQPYDVQSVHTYASLVEISLSPNDGSLLAETRRGCGREAALVRWGANWKKSVAAAAHIRLSPEAVMSLYYTERGLVTIRWTHNRDVQSLLDLMLRVLQELDSRSGNITVRSYSASGIDSLDTTATDLQSDLGRNWDALLAAEYMEAEQSGNVVLFADKDPIEGDEKQLGVVIHPQLLHRRALKIIATAVCESSFVPLNETIATVIISNLCSALDVSVRDESL